MHGPAIVPHVYRVLQVDTMGRNAVNARNVGESPFVPNS